MGHCKFQALFQWTLWSPSWSFHSCGLHAECSSWWAQYWSLFSSWLTSWHPNHCNQHDISTSDCWSCHCTWFVSRWLAICAPHWNRESHLIHEEEWCWVITELFMEVCCIHFPFMDRLGSFASLCPEVSPWGSSGTPWLNGWLLNDWRFFWTFVCTNPQVASGSVCSPCPAFWQQMHHGVKAQKTAFSQCFRVWSDVFWH